MALPVIRADFKALETYMPQPWPEGAAFEGIPENIPQEHKCKTALTVFGGHNDHFVTAEASFGWWEFVVGGPGKLDEMVPIYRPETDSAFAAAPNAEILADQATEQPPFRLFMDKEGTHFTAFDKEGGGAAWVTEIIRNTCNRCPRITIPSKAIK